MSSPRDATFLPRLTQCVIACLMLIFTLSLGLALYTGAPIEPGLSPRGNQAVLSFGHAKALLLGLYMPHPRTLYSDCAFTRQKRVDYAACAYHPLVLRPRAERIEWEHIVPAEAFGHAFASWREGHPRCIDSRGRGYVGRRCASHTDPQFRQMEADLYNLVPEIGEINQMRSNFPMASLDETTGHQLPGVAIRVGKHAFEPRPDARGDVARTYLYMAWAYPGRGILSKKSTKLFRAWASQDPVDAWECERAFAIERMQGNINPMVKRPCQASGLWPKGKNLIEVAEQEPVLEE